MVILSFFIFMLIWGGIRGEEDCGSRRTCVECVTDGECVYEVHFDPSGHPSTTTQCHPRSHLDQLNQKDYPFTTFLDHQSDCHLPLSPTSPTNKKSSLNDSLASHTVELLKNAQLEVDDPYLRRLRPFLSQLNSTTPTSEEVWKKVDDFLKTKGSSGPQDLSVVSTSELTISATTTVPLVTSDLPKVIQTSTSGAIGHSTTNPLNQTTETISSWVDSDLQFWTDKRIFFILAGTVGLLIILAGLAIIMLILQEMNSGLWCTKNSTRDASGEFELAKFNSPSHPPHPHETLV